MKMRIKKKPSSREIKLVTIGSVASEIGIGQRRALSLRSITRSQMSEEDETYNLEDKKYKYAIFGNSSSCLSFCANPICYLVWYCSVLFYQSMVVNGFINSSIASLEKRYKLSSKESSLIASMYDIGCMLVVLPVSFYGSKGHKPLWIGVGAFIMGLSCFIYASPQFLSGSYKYAATSDKDIHLCGFNNHTLQCNETLANYRLQNFKYFFYSGQFCLGIGGSPLFTLGVAYIEEINSKSTSSLHIGISTAITAIGPAVGYVLLGSLLKVYVDIKVPSKYMTPDETEIWVGAWWIGFIFAGFSLILLSIPLIMFPKIEIISDENDNNKLNNTEISNSDFFDISKIVKNIALNLTYVCVSLGTTFTMLTLSGISTYGPKYFESVFGLTSSIATITVGIISVPTLATGALVGGILLSKYNWKLNGTLMFMAITTLISAPFAVTFLFVCQESKMAGVNYDYNGKIKYGFTNLISLCNEKCYCEDYDFRPSCGVNNLSYFSPCFAGCKTMKIKEDVTVFSNCSCIDTSQNDYQLQYKSCPMQLCIYFYITLIILGVMLFFTYLRGAPSITATMRAVSSSEIALALGCQSILSRIFGSIPGPILFGWFIDRACLLWKQKCNLLGNCLKYNIGQLTKSFFFIISILTFLNAVCFIIPRSVLAIKEFRK